MPGDGQGARERLFPGIGRRRAVAYPKGRPVDPAALAEVRALLGERPRRRDLLIEHLHLIQDQYGSLSVAHLAALACEMRLALAEVYEVATFYAHFDVVGDGEPAPPPLTVRVCQSVSCFLRDAARLRERLEHALGPGVRVLPAACVGRCDRAPVAVVGHCSIDQATVEAVEQAVSEGRVEPEIPAYADFDAYMAQGGYKVLRDCRTGRRSPDDVIAALDASGLRGLGGAGFRSGLKWKLVRQEPKPRLMAVNADEGEPGTFKDRHYLETDPHRMLEGMLIACWAIEADEVYIYLRDEYSHIHEILKCAIAKLAAEGLAPAPTIHLRRGAGAYICGEETAMLESIEGKRGYPRHKPPFPTQVGLFGRPTLIHNVETLAWVRDILERGPAWFSAQGRQGRQGPRSFSVSGRVKQPGVKLAPAGITVRQLIDEYCGGMQEGHTFMGYLPGGASGGILPARLGDVPLDFGTLEEHGCFIGSAAVVVLSDQDDPRAVALNLMRFFEKESCGQCTPCRCGTEKAVQLMERPCWDESLLKELSAAMREASICGLGQAAPNPLLSVLRYFAEEPRS
jgi:NADH:ubiquinone oxidoreductase subunit F (NADH-binding)/NADH:ubiquinone oxidoreductase subunit E